MRTLDGLNWLKDKQVNVLALVVKSDKQVNGIEFFTPSSFSQQLAVMSHPSGHKILPHYHLPVSRDVVGTQEVIVMRSGSMRLDLYDESQAYVGSANLEKGDVALLTSGGHGFTALDNPEFLEVKQGPYSEEQDKIRFLGVTEAQEIKWFGESN